MGPGPKFSGSAAPRTAPELDPALPSEIPLERTIAGWVSLSPSTTPADGYDDPSISGGTALENRFLIDGIDFGDVGFGSPGPSSAARSFGLSFPREFLRSVAVSGAAFDVELPAATGGIIESRTRNGGDDVHGSLAATLAPATLQSSRRQLPNPRFGEPDVGRSAREDGALVVTGPLVRGLSHFSAGLGRVDSRQDLRSTALGVINGAHANRFESRLPYFASAELEKGDHRFEAFALGDGGASPWAPQTAGDLSGPSTGRYRRIAFGIDGQRLHYAGDIAHLERGVLHVDLSVSHASSRSLTSFHSADDQDRFTDLRNPSAIVRGGGVGYYVRTGDGDSLNTHAALRAEIMGFGRHTVRLGLDHVSASYSIEHTRTGAPGATFIDEQGNPRTFQTGLAYLISYAGDNVTPIYRVVGGTFEGARHRADVERVSPFVAEEWELPFFTIDAALRATSQSLRGSGAGATRANFAFSTGLSPRAGISKRISVRDARGTVYLRGARYVEDVPAAVAAEIFSTEGVASRVDYFSSNFVAQNQIPDGQVPDYTGSTQHVLTFNSIGTPKTSGATPTTEDELVAGTSWDLPGDLAMSGRLIHRSLVRILETYAPVAYEDVVSGAANFGSYTLGNPGSALGPGWRKPVRNYDALELSLAKPFATRGILAVSYRLSSLRGNYEGFVDPVSGATPNFGDAFDFPNDTPATAATGRPGPLPLDRTHVLKVAGAWRTVHGFGLGAVLDLASGTPRTTLDTNLAYGVPGAFVEKRRGDLGHEPSLASLERHADYALAFRRTRALVFAIDVFNVTNSQTIVAHDDSAQIDDGTPSATYRRPNAFQPPRTARLAVRLDF